MMKRDEEQKVSILGEFRTHILVGALFFGGMIAGLSLAAMTAPMSETALFIGFMVWPVSFGLGMTLWYSVTSSQLFGRLIRALFTSLKTWDLDEALRDQLDGLDWQTMTGTRVFVPTTVLLSFFAGLAIACNPAARDFEVVVCCFTGVGLLYSMLVTRLARAGILPKPRAI